MNKKLLLTLLLLGSANIIFSAASSSKLEAWNGDLDSSDEAGGAPDPKIRTRERSSSHLDDFLPPEDIFPEQDASALVSRPRSASLRGRTAALGSSTGTTSAFGSLGGRQRVKMSAPKYGIQKTEMQQSAYEKDKQEIEKLLKEVEKFLETVKKFKLHKREDLDIENIRSMVKDKNEKNPLAKINGILDSLKSRLQEKIKNLLEDAERAVQIIEGPQSQGFEINATYSLDSLHEHQRKQPNICRLITTLNLKVGELIELAINTQRISELKNKIERRIRPLSQKNRIHFKDKIRKALCNYNPIVRLLELQALAKEVNQYLQKRRSQTPIHRQIGSPGGVLFKTIKPSSESSSEESAATSPRISPYPPIYSAASAAPPATKIVPVSPKSEEGEIVKNVHAYSPDIEEYKAMHGTRPRDYATGLIDNKKLLPWYLKLLLEIEAKKESERTAIEKAMLKEYKDNAASGTS